MMIQRSVQTVPPIIKRPDHNPDQFKTPSQQKVEIETNVANHQVKQIAQEATDKVYDMLESLVKNTAYNVSYSVGKHGEEKQVKLSLDRTGEEILSLPPDIAITIAERAKQSTIGLLMDVRA